MKKNCEVLGSTLSCLQDDMGKGDKQLSKYTFCKLFDPLKILVLPGQMFETT